MTRLEKTILLPMLLLIIILGACSNSIWDEIPTPITSFIEQYYPNSNVKEFNTTDNGYKLKINNGASFSFDNDYRWTSIDGNGVHLPEVLVYNQLPPALFNYLQGIEAQTSVFSMSRDSTYYKLLMLDTVITYEIATGKITYPDGKTLDS
ncbi:MAG: hypothetical protein NC212_07950 [Staphylococcus sp.]|nr:hypothetical protein [Staphylococcus sp.]